MRFPTWLEQYPRLPANAWDTDWHSTLRDQAIDGDHQAALTLVVVAARGTKAFAPDGDEDEWSDTVVRIIERIPRWDPSKASWVTYIRSCVWGWRKNHRSRERRTNHRHPVFDHAGLEALDQKSHRQWPYR